MAEKKRKGADSSSAQPSKKSKKSVKIVPEPTVLAEEVVTVAEPVEKDDLAAKPSRKTRKRAADFLYDEAGKDTPTTKKGKKDEVVSLTADGANGVVEHSDDEGVTITTSKKPKKKSMMAEAERTQDAELADEFGGAAQSEDEDIDTAPALLTGFDSDNEDLAEDKNFDASRVAPIPQFKKTSKKLRQAKESGSDGPGAVYIGRIPHGFYETQMREYFAQFGTITRLRLSRNKTTGASKHFAFVEFESDQVAKIVADTMDNYLMFGHILKCKYAPTESLHEDVWKGANKKYRKIPKHKLLKQKAEEPKNEEQIEKKIKKTQKKREQKLKQLKGMGYEYELPTLVKPDPSSSITAKEEILALEDKVEGALVPPPSVPKDEVAVKVEEKKKEKKAKKSKNNKLNVDKEDVEPIAPVTLSDVIVEAAEPQTKKGKKSKKAEVVAESAPVIVEEVAVAVEEPSSKKGRKAKKEAAIEITSTIVEPDSIVVTEEAPKKGKKSKKETQKGSESDKDKKQLKSILKKSNKA